MSPRFAWPQYRNPWVLTVELVEQESFDPPPQIDASIRRINLHESTWENATLRLHLSTTEKVPEGVDEQSAYVLISSSRSNTRIPVPLSRAEMEDQIFTGEVTLNRSLLAGPVDITGQVLTTDETTRLVGEAEPWILVVEASSAPPLPGAPPFEISWAHFEGEDAPALLKQARDSLMAMDLTGPKPALYLNEDVEGFKAILGSTRARLEKRRLRDNVATEVARYALSALFREACAEVEVEDDDVFLPDEPLLRQVCDVVAGQVDSVADTDELFRRLQSDRTQRRALWIEIDSALDRLTNHSEALATSLGEVHYAKA